MNPNDDLSAEFHKLGENLKSAVKTAWESEERRRLQSELEAGLAALGTALRDSAQSETGQRLKAEVNDLGKRVKSGEVEQRLRTDLLNALRALNLEIEKMSQKEDKEDQA